MFGDHLLGDILVDVFFLSNFFIDLKSLILHLRNEFPHIRIKGCQELFFWFKMQKTWLIGLLSIFTHYFIKYFLPVGKLLHHTLYFLCYYSPVQGKMVDSWLCHFQVKFSREANVGLDLPMILLFHFQYCKLSQSLTKQSVQILT